MDAAHRRPFDDRPALEPARTMAEVIALVRADGDLPPVRWRNLASSIRRFCDALGVAPERAEASFVFFRKRIEGFHPLEVGIKKARWQTIKSDVGFALKRVGVPRMSPLAYYASHG